MSKGNLSSSSTTDDALIAAIRRGEERALSQLYQAHWPMVSHFVLQNSGTEADAQDVYQEGVMVFYEKVRDNSLELSCQIKTYLYAVCRRLWLKRLTSRSRVSVVTGGRRRNARLAPLVTRRRGSTASATVKPFHVA